jgi:hypothetical protein
MNVFPDFVVHRADRSPGEIWKRLQSAELVIADVRDNDPSVFYEIGLRHFTGKPIIFLSDRDANLPFYDYTREHYVLFVQEGAEETVRDTLVKLIPTLEFDQPPQVEAVSVPSLADFADRIDIVATTIANLRINSLTQQVEELQNISRELRATFSRHPSEIASPKDFALRALRILTNLFDSLGSQRGAQIIIAGAVTGILMAGGWPSAAIFALTLAVWQGKDAFQATLEKILNPTESARRGRRRRGRRGGRRAKRSE